jgi:exonuclease III
MWQRHEQFAEYVEKVKRKKEKEGERMTKGDWVRSMNDEDLANWLCQITTCSQCEFIDECRTGENGAYNWLIQKYRGRDND